MNTTSAILTSLFMTGGMIAVFVLMYGVIDDVTDVPELMIDDVEVIVQYADEVDTGNRIIKYEEGDVVNVKPGEPVDVYLPEGYLDGGEQVIDFHIEGTGNDMEDVVVNFVTAEPMYGGNYYKINARIDDDTFYTFPLDSGVKEEDVFDTDDLLSDEFLR